MTIECIYVYNSNKGLSTNALLKRKLTIRGRKLLKVTKLNRLVKLRNFWGFADRSVNLQPKWYLSIDPLIQGGQLGAPSWDLFIALFFIIGISYGFILQREKVTGTLVSTYVALVVTQIATPYIQQFFSGQTTIGSIFIKASPTPFMIKTAVFAIIVILLTTRGGLAGMRGHGLLTPIEVIIYSGLTSLIAISTIVSFLDEGVRATLVSDSRFASIIIQYHDMWLIAPVVILIAMGFRRHGKHGELYE